MRGARVAGIVLVVVGILGLIVGVVYLTVAVDKLPSFLGHIAHPGKHHLHHTRRALVGFVLGGILTVAGLALLVYKPAVEED